MAVFKLTNNINDLWRNWQAIKDYAESESAFTVFASQSANRIFAAPDGVVGTPNYRSLVANDIPNFDTSKITSGTFDASIIGSGIIDNARINWASPSAIGTTTPAAGTFVDVRVTTGFYGGRVQSSIAISDLNVNANTMIVDFGAITAQNLNLPSLATLYIAINGTSGFSPLLFLRNRGTGLKTVIPAGGEDIDGAASIPLPNGSAVLLAGISTTRWRAMMDFP